MRHHTHDHTSEKRALRAVLLLIVALLLTPAVAAADGKTKTYNLKDGSTVTGTVIDEGETAYLVRTADGKTIRVPYDQIEKVEVGTRPYRLLSETEIAKAVVITGWPDADSKQSFMLQFPPFKEAALLASGCKLVLVSNARVANDWAVRPFDTYDNATWDCAGSVYGIAFWDVNGDGFRDVLALAWGYNGIGGYDTNSYRNVSLLLNDGKSTFVKTGWGDSVPYEIVDGGLASIRDYAKENPPNGTVEEALVVERLMKEKLDATLESYQESIRASQQAQLAYEAQQAQQEQQERHERLERQAQQADRLDTSGRYSVLTTIVIDRSFFVSERDGDPGGSDPDIVLKLTVDGKDVARSDEASDSRTASWIADVDWSPGQSVELLVMDIDIIGYTTLFNLKWDRPATFPLTGGVDLAAQYGVVVGSSSLEFELQSVPR